MNSDQLGCHWTWKTWSSLKFEIGAWKTWNNMKPINIYEQNLEKKFCQIFRQNFQILQFISTIYDQCQLRLVNLWIMKCLFPKVKVKVIEVNLWFSKCVFEVISRFSTFYSIWCVFFWAMSVVHDRNSQKGFDYLLVVTLSKCHYCLSGKVDIV